MQAWADNAFEHQHQKIYCWLANANVQSPIEKVMGTALANIHSLAMEGFGGTDYLTQLTAPDEFSQLHDEGLFQISPQVKVGPYTVDFAIRCFACADYRLAVECDGHNFHEKTKEQAAHDKKRDRELQKYGYNIIRFTGSEIWSDPVGCAVEVFEHFAAKLGGDGWSAIHRKADEIWMGH